jgi:5-methylcytosine-specific restriction endonuclease McrA
MQGMGASRQKELVLMSRAWRNGTPKGWRAIRERILKRDGYTCQRCGTNEGQMHIDHIVPKRLNGSDLDENLQTLCRNCNLMKGGRFFEGDLKPPTLHGRYIPQNVSVSHE